MTTLPTRHIQPLPVLPLLILLLVPTVTLALSLAPTFSHGAHTVTATAVGPPWSRSDAQDVLDTVLLRSVDKGHRLQLREDVVAGTVVAGSDASLEDTAYGEFPLSSLDVLLDRALATIRTSTPETSLTVVDLGSGCGRIALYLALTRPSWRVHGVELAGSLHDEACRALHDAVQWGYFDNARDHASSDHASSDHATSASHVSLHWGRAADYANLLATADVIFCYSTAFGSAAFSTDASALILGRDWNQLLYTACHGRPATAVCITTDKALDPLLGWTILDRITVPNPEVVESIGYIQQLSDHSVPPPPDRGGLVGSIHDSL